MKLFQSNLQIGFLVGLTACGGAQNSNTDPAKLDGDATTAGIQFSLSSASSQTALRALTAGTPELSEARVSIREIKLEMQEGRSCADLNLSDERIRCEEETELEDGISQTEVELVIEGPFVFDMVSQTSTPDLSDLQIPSGVYKEIEFRIDDAEVEDGVVTSGDELDGHSLVAAGQFLDLEGNAQNFELRLNFNEEWEIENEAGIEVVEGLNNNILLQFAGAGWFEAVDLATCFADDELEVDESGVVQISEETSGSGDCSDIESLIKDNIKQKVELDKDESEDDSDDESEDDE